MARCDEHTPHTRTDLQLRLNMSEDSTVTPLDRQQLRLDMPLTDTKLLIFTLERSVLRP